MSSVIDVVSASFLDIISFHCPKNSAEAVNCSRSRISSPFKVELRGAEIMSLEENRYVLSLVTTLYT